MKLKILFIISLCVITFCCFNKNSNSIAQQEQCTIDSLYTIIDVLQLKINILESVIDSLPLSLPLDTFFIQDKFGIRKHPIFRVWQTHSGLDMIDTWRDTVYATGDGVVKQAGWNYGYGKYIEIEHAFNFASRYAHLYKVLVSKGQDVKKGQTIGIMGSTGTATGDHLHYEIKYNGRAVNPMPYINSMLN